MEIVSRQLGGLGFQSCKGQVSSSCGLRAWIRNELGWNPGTDFTTYYLCVQLEASQVASLNSSSTTENFKKQDKAL